jgi:hypothetical protein
MRSLGALLRLLAPPGFSSCNPALTSPSPEAPQRGSTDYLDELERMHVLMQQGALTEAEFQAHKDRILASPSSTSRCAAAAAPEPAAAVATATVAEPELNDAEIMPDHIKRMLGSQR